jgi:hypothetical protein
VIQKRLDLSCQDIGLAFIYLDHQAAQSLKPADYVSSLLRQLEQHKETLSPSIKEEYDKLSKRGFKPNLNTLTALLADSVKSFTSRTYIILDAFDECVDSGRRELVEILDSLLSRNDRVYLFITSRPNSHLDAIESSSPNETRTINVVAGDGAQTRDLKRYLDSKLAKERMSDEERVFISQGILKKAQGLYNHSILFAF